jgi:hypothetical protein
LSFFLVFSFSNLNSNRQQAVLLNKQLKDVVNANNAEHWPADLRRPSNWLSTSLKPSTVWVLGAVASAS